MRAELLQRTVEGLRVVEALFDRIPDVVFFVKDTEARYVVVNQTLVGRCGVPSKADLLGRTTREVFPSPFGDRYLEQDLSVCSGGAPVQGQLELHLYPNRLEGWCLTEKLPLRADGDRIIGMAGISRDLQAPGRGLEGLSELASAVEHLRASFDHIIRVEKLAAMAGLSAYQLNRRLRAVFGITAGQLIVKTRVDAASHLLREGRRSIADIAQRCGYCDQSAFTRQFRRTTGVTPQQYRERHGGMRNGE